MIELPIPKSIIIANENSFYLVNSIYRFRFDEDEGDKFITHFVEGRFHLLKGKFDLLSFENHWQHNNKDFVKGTLWCRPATVKEVAQLKIEGLI